MKLNYDFGQRRESKLAPRNWRVATTMHDIQGRGMDLGSRDKFKLDKTNGVRDWRIGEGSFVK